MGGRTRSNKGKVFYVYALLDSRKPGKHRYGRWVFGAEPFYIGKGHGNRVLSHLSTSAEAEITKGSTFKAKLSRKILREGFEIGYRIIKAGLTEKEAFKRENELILRIGRRTKSEGPLTNLTDGGEGDSGNVVSPKTKRALRKRALEQNSSMTDEERKIKSKKLSDAHNNRASSAERARVNKIRASWDSRSPDEQERINEKKRRTRRVNGWVPKPKLTKKRRAENESLRRSKISNYFASLTDEQREELAEKKRRSMLATVARRSSAEKAKLSAKISEGLSAMSARAKAAASKKISDSRKAYFQNLDPRSKKQWQEKISQTKLMRSKH